MMGLSSWRGLSCKGPTSLSGAMVSHHIMDYAMQGLKPERSYRADSKPLASVLLWENSLLTGWRNLSRVVTS